MNIKNTVLFYMMLACLVSHSGANAMAASSTEWIRTDQSSLRLISEREGVAGRDSLRIGLQIKLAPGWKTYWRTPGDAGIPPNFDWSGSENLKDASVSWPLPESFETYGLTSWGYQDEVVFPVEVSLKEAGEPLELKLRLQLGICEKVCIPYEHDFTFFLDVGTPDISPEASIIDKYAKHVPSVIGSSATAFNGVRATALNGEDFKVAVSNSTLFKAPQIIVEGKEGAYFQLMSTSISEDRKAANFTLKADLPAKTDILPGQRITVTISDEGRAAEGKLHVK